MLHEVFPAVGPRHPFTQISKYIWLPSQVEQRPDGLAMPSLASTGAKAPKPPVTIPWKHADSGQTLKLIA